MAELLPVDSFDLIIFGGTGDLAMRKLLPALYHRDRDGQIPADSRIFALGQRPLKRAEYVAQAGRALAANLAADDFDQGHWERFSTRLDYLGLNALDHSAWAPLRTALAGGEEKTRIAYLATPPALYGPVATGLQANNLMTPDTRIVLEKPVGNNYQSARAINDAVGACFPENQIFRIDHYLGKETVQNLLALRFGNSLFEPLWRREVIDNVQITVAEELGVGNRIEFYDGIGTLRDMVQNHLLQLVCLVAMEPPSSLDSDAVRDEKLKVLKALRPITEAEVRRRCVRGQYAAGAIAGCAVPGYAEELGAASDTETFVALKLHIDNWRWSGVPFYLRTGKRLPAKHSEIVIRFKSLPHVIFPGAGRELAPNCLSIMLQPDEGIRLKIMTKAPGPGRFELRPASLDLSFAAAFGLRYPDAYERLLVEVMRGNPGLFMRRDEIEAAWQWIDGIHAGWREARPPLETYVAGSWGPTASSILLDRDGRDWQADG